MKSATLAAALSILPVMAAAQSGIGLSFSAGLGASVTPDYFGSDDYGLGARGGFEFGHLRIGDLEVGDPDPNAVTLGLHALAGRWARAFHGQRNHLPL